MKDLTELIKFVGPKYLRQTSILANKSQDTQLSKLYEELKKNPNKSEEEVVKIIFKSSDNVQLFKQLKSKLKNRLVNNLFLIDTSQAQFKSIADSFQNCRKLFLAAEILYVKGAKSSAIKLAEKAYRVGEKFDFADICEMSAFFLRNAYRVKGNKSKLKFYRKKSEYYLNKVVNQKRIRNIYLNIADDIALYKEFSIKEKNNLLSQEKELMELLQTVDNPGTYTYAYSAICMINSIHRKFAKVIGISKSAILELEKKKDIPKIYLLNFYDMIISAALTTNDFQIGKTAIEDSRPILKSIMGLNKIFLLENYMQLALRTGNYSQAIDLYEGMTNDQIWKKAPRRTIEIWNLFAAYIALFQEIDKEAFKGVPKFKFKIGKFMNSSVELKKDKLVYNLSFLFFQTLYFIYRNDYDEVVNCLNSLGSYNYRYLKKEESLRSQYYIKMLLKIPEANFHRAAVIRKSKSWFNKLRAEKQQNTLKPSKSEIILYEVQWELILEMLENRFRRKPSTLQS